MLNSFLSRPSGKNEQLGKRLSKTLSQSPSLRIRGRTVNNSAKRNFVNALQCNNKPLPSFLLSIRPLILPSIGSTTKQQKIMTTSSTHPWCYDGTMAADDGIQHNKSNVPTNHPCVPVDLSETDWWWWCHSCCFAGHCWNPVGVWDEDGP